MLSILIVNWNTAALLRECLASIEAHPPTGEVEVIVVDNASADGSAAMVSDEFPAVRLIENTANASYAAGNNQALEAASGDYLLLLNPDVRLIAGALDAAVQFLAARPRAGAVGARQIGADGRVQRSVRGFPTPSGLTAEILGFSRLAPRSRTLGEYRMTYFDYGQAAEVDQPMATFLMVKREVYEAVGGMDEVFPLFFNDVDWCYRIKQAGWQIWYTPNVEIVHYGGSGTAQAPKPAVIRESHRSLIRFYEKHYRDAMPPAAFAAIRAAIIAGERARIAAAKLPKLKAR